MPSLQQGIIQAKMDYPNPQFRLTCITKSKLCIQLKSRIHQNPCLITISTTELIQIHNLKPPPLIHQQEKKYIKIRKNSEITMIKEKIP